MKLFQPHTVEGTHKPTITIGRRTPTARAWTAQWCQGSKQHTRSLNVTTKREAILAAMELFKHLQSGHAPAPIKPITISDLCTAYEKMTVDKGRAPATISSYRNALKRFREFCAEKRVISAAAFTEDDLWAFRKWSLDTRQLAGKEPKLGVTEKTVYFRLVLVKQLMKWACRTRRIPVNHCAIAEIREPIPRPQPVFDHIQVGKLLNHADEPWRTLWAAFAYAGLRFGEMRDLEWSDVLFNEDGGGTLVITKGGSREGTTKGNELRQIPMHSNLRPMLEALPRHGKQVFMSPPATKRYRWGKLNERTVLAMLKEHCAACGFPDADRFKVHSFRHTFVSQLARTQGSARYAMELAGHKTSKVAQMYFKRYDADAERQIGKLHYPTSTVNPPDTTPSPT